MSNLQSWLARTIALLIAWSVPQMLASIAGMMIGFRIWPCVLFGYGLDGF